MRWWREGGGGGDCGGVGDDCGGDEREMEGGGEMVEL